MSGNTTTSHDNDGTNYIEIQTNTKIGRLRLGDEIWGRIDVKTISRDERTNDVREREK